MRRVWLIIGIILLVAGVLFEERHRAETLKHLLHPAGAIIPAEELFALKENNFHDYVDLWDDPWVKANDTNFNSSSIAVENFARPGTVDKFQPRAGNKTDPALTVQNRQLDYNVFNLGGFKLNLDFKPAYATPEALLPNRIDPGISGSFNF